MNTATIYFCNGETLIVQENDLITPITKSEQNGDIFASMSRPIKIELHTQNGLIPSILGAFYSCNYFFINEDQSIIYGVNCIIKVVDC